MAEEVINRPDMTCMNNTIFADLSNLLLFDVTNMAPSIYGLAAPRQLGMCHNFSPLTDSAFTVFMFSEILASSYM